MEQPGSAAAEIRERMKPVAESMGIRLPSGADGDDDARIAPQVNLNWPVGRRLARELGQLICRCGIFVMGDRIVTVDEITGKVRTMSSRRFGSWIEQWVDTVKFGRDGGMHSTTMGDQLARQVLESDQFVNSLWKLKGVHPVRMPVFRNEGKRVELLKHGYDEESQIYTARGPAFREDMTIEEAKLVFFNLLKDYPFADLAKDKSNFFENRSVAVQVALMVGTFCRGLFEPGVLRPMGIMIGNQPGTGKGMLAQMVLAPVFGMPHLGRKPRNDDEFEKQLDTCALAFAPYLVLDDIGGGLFSNALNAFITNPVHSGRKMGGQEGFEAENVTQVVATGNQIKTTRDLERRSLIVELHLAGEVEGRSFDQVITPQYLARAEVRAELLAAMWAIVREWSEAGCNRVMNVKPSFEGWTSAVAAIVRCGYFADPLVKPDLGLGGDEEGAAWRGFLGRLAGECIMPGETDRSFTVAAMLEKAREWEEDEHSGFSMDDLVGSARDQNKAFGRRISKWKGREIKDTQGRLVEFGKLRQGKARLYPCTILSEGAVKDAPVENSQDRES